MQTICGLDCCNECSMKEKCGGCIKTDGHPFGGTCIAADNIKKSGVEAFKNLKQDLIKEFNTLDLENLQIEDLNLLAGFYVNLEYQLDNGQTVKLLDDNKIYLGNQVEIPGSDRCYGIVADEQYLLVCQYGCGGSDPQIIVYKKR